MSTVAGLRRGDRDPLRERREGLSRARQVDPLLADLTPGQGRALRCGARRLLLLAQPGCGGKEVLVRRVASWAGREGVAASQIAVVSHSKGACARLQVRLSQQLPPRVEIQPQLLSQLAFSLLVELHPQDFGGCSLVGEGVLFTLADRFYREPLQLETVRERWRLNRHHAIRDFLHARRLLQQFDAGQAQRTNAPQDHPQDHLGDSPLAQAFAFSSEALRHLLQDLSLIDRSTAELEAVRLLEGDPGLAAQARKIVSHVAIEHVQDLTPLQHRLLSLLVGEQGSLIALGDFKQAIGRGRRVRVQLLRGLRDELEQAPDGDVRRLDASLRANPGLLQVVNHWGREWTEAAGLGEELQTPPIMQVGAPERPHPSQLLAVRAEDVERDASWVAEAIEAICAQGGASRPQDVAILLRSWASARTFMLALQGRGIPAIFEGSQVFAQPATLAIVAALMRCAGFQTLPGSSGELSLYGHVVNTLRCDPHPEAAIEAACKMLRQERLPVRDRAAATLLRHSRDLCRQGEAGQWPQDLTLPGVCRRLLDLLQAERWEATAEGREATAAFHLGSLASLADAVALPQARPHAADPHRRFQDFRSEAFALAAWAPRNAEDFEGDLQAAPPAVRILTPEQARGRAFEATFVADLRAHVMPSKVAKRPQRLPFDGEARRVLDPQAFADDQELAGERSVLHIALTRSQRHLILTSSGRNKSSFWKWIEVAVPQAGGVSGGREEVGAERLSPSAMLRRMSPTRL